MQAPRSTGRLELLLAAIMLACLTVIVGVPQAGSSSSSASSRTASSFRFNTATLEWATSCDPFSNERVIEWRLTSLEDTGIGVRLFPPDVIGNGSPIASDSFTPDLLPNLGDVATMATRLPPTFSGTLRIDVPIGPTNLSVATVNLVRTLLILPCSGGRFSMECSHSAQDPERRVSFVFDNDTGFQLTDITGEARIGAHDPIPVAFRPDSVASSSSTTAEFVVPGSHIGTLVLTVHHNPGAFTSTFQTQIATPCEPQRPATTTTTAAPPTTSPPATTTVATAPPNPPARSTARGRQTTRVPSHLASTGGSVEPFVVAALIAIALGSALILKSRRRDHRFGNRADTA